MTNEQIFFYVAIGSIVLIGSYAVVLAVMLDKASKLIEKQKAEIARMVLPPF
jgi:K+-transporting ATPase A subunit